MNDWQPRAEWLDTTFETVVRPLLFGDRGNEIRPLVLMVGGQPRSGKTRAGNFARRLHPRDLVVVNGDDFRALHPHYNHLQRHDPEQMPVITQSVSGPMVERCIRYATQQRISVLVEGTFRDPVLVTDTAHAYHEAGFQVHAVALAVPPLVSRASTLNRFQETQGTGQNRWTPPHAHQAALDGLLDTVTALATSPAVARMSVMTREGEVLADSGVPGPDRARETRAVIELTHERPLRAEERRVVDDAAGTAARG